MLQTDRIRSFFAFLMLMALSACGGVEEIPRNDAPVANDVFITDDEGSALVGDVLIGRYTYVDTEDDDEGASAFRWLRNGEEITGATRTSYTLVLDDSGKTITFEVTPNAAIGTIEGRTVVSEGITISNSAPTAINVKIIDENAKEFEVGDLLRGQYRYVDADGDSEDEPIFRWLRNGNVLGGETEETYTLQQADFGQSVTFEVIPIAKTGKIKGVAAASEDSAPTASDVEIIDDNDGVAVVGNSLTGSYFFEDRENSAEGVSTFRWLRNGFAIDGATNISYLIVLEDSDQLIAFEVTPVAAIGAATGSAVVSKSIRVINNAPTANNVSVSDKNGGRAVVGDRLAGSYTYADVEGDKEGETSFRWLRNNVVIGGATASTYTLVAKDVAAYIAFEVTPVAEKGEAKGVSVSSSVLATGTIPVVSGYARYLDLNKDGSIDSGDQIVIPFDQKININGAVFSGLELFVTGDAFGTGAGFAEGPADNEITVTLGILPQFKVAGDFSAGKTTVGSASGLDVAASMALNAIEGTSGIDAESSTAIDLIPAYVEDVQLLGENDSNSIALGDVNGDGDLDMVVANQGQANRVYSNDGTGNFSDSGQSLGGNDSYAVALGNLDGDGDLDMVVANWATGNRVYFNDGNGKFLSSGQLLGMNFSTAIVLANLDGDVGGNLDIAVANWNQGNRVYINNGLGNFSDSGQSLGTGKSYSIVAGDLNGNGHLDMVVANYGQSNRIYNNDGTGNFTDSGQSLGANNTLSLALGDVDGDGDLDLVEANSTGQSNRVYINDSKGVFIDSGQLLGENNSLSVILADVDGDTDLDMFVANNNGQANRVYINDGGGVFTDSGQQLGKGNSHAVALGNLEGSTDPDIDMAVANRGQANKIYFGSLCDGGC